MVDRELGGLLPSLHMYRNSNEIQRLFGWSVGIAMCISRTSGCGNMYRDPTWPIELILSLEGLLVPALGIPTSAHRGMLFHGKGKGN